MRGSGSLLARSSVVGDRVRHRRGRAVVVDLDEHTELGQPIAHRGDACAERSVEHQRFGVGVLEQRGELAGFVPEVHVRRQRAQLRTGERALHVLGAIEEEQRDVRARPDAVGRELGSQAGGVVLDVAPRHAPLTLDDGGRVGDGVGDRLPDSGEALVHGVPTSTIQG